MAKLTARQVADQIAAQINAKFHTPDPSDSEFLQKLTKSGAATVYEREDSTPVVSWDAGPFEWTTDFEYAMHREYVGPALKEMGKDPTFRPDPNRKPLYTVPKGFRVEAMNETEIGVYKD